VPSRIVSAEDVAPSKSRSSERGGTVKGVLCACLKCRRLRSQSFSTTAAGASMVIQSLQSFGLSVGLAGT
jgi:hypothetical protein